MSLSAAAWAASEVLQIGAAVVTLVQLRRRIAALTAATRTDELTGLGNRRGLTAALARRVAPPAVLLLDVRRFKGVNDRYGYHAGDELLRQVAARLHQIAARHAGVAARLGGDEFALLLPIAAAADVTAVIAEVERALATPLHLPDAAGQVELSAVFGASLPPAALSDRPLRAADIALHYARHHGLQAVIYRPGMTYPAAEDRHGPRLRDRPGAAPVIETDTDLLHQLMTVPGSGSAAGPARRLTELAERCDPRSSTFGTAAAELVAALVTHRVLWLHEPVTDVRLEATAAGPHRDGALLLLVTFADTLTLCSAPMSAPSFAHPAVEPVEFLLATVVDTVVGFADAYCTLRAQRADR
ncbi:GGDEF domain-containing protein [Actinoplanes sp. NPDC026619]|uniref:GGDEF domain-containing protein n=1 Tax=Actinoplanes sp. NPDC026619 TaxID=3155798 RepID=UPI0033D9E105